MDRQSLSWQMTAEQFAAFDTQLYLDTHPDDMVALKMFDGYIKAHGELKKEYEEKYGPLMADSGVMGDKWAWVEGPWPWEKEDN